MAKKASKSKNDCSSSTSVTSAKNPSTASNHQMALRVKSSEKMKKKAEESVISEREKRPKSKSRPKSKLKKKTKIDAKMPKKPPTAVFYFFMCHYCGAEITKTSEDKRKLENGNALISCSGDPIRSCKLCWERQGREFVKRDGITPYSTPMISPTSSLSSSDRSYSSCSDFSVDVINSYDRVEGDQEFGSKNSHGELNCLPNGRNPCSEGLGKRLDSSNLMSESDLRDKKDSNDMDIVRDGEITQTSNEQEAKENVIENSARPFVKESGVSQVINGEIDNQIWEPPEPEDPEDNLENSLAYDDDDDEDDECGDGTKWGKPSSLSHTDVGNGRYRFKEEKERAIKEVIDGKFKAIVSQLLESVGVTCSVSDNDSWVDIVTSLSLEAALFLKPDAIDGNAMGPDLFVKVKCIATGSRSQR